MESDDNMYEIRLYAKFYNQMLKFSGELYLREEQEPEPKEDSPRLNMIKYLCGDPGDFTLLPKIYTNDNDKSIFIFEKIKKFRCNFNIMQHNGKSDNFPYAYFENNVNIKYTNKELLDKLDSYIEKIKCNS